MPPTERVIQIRPRTVLTVAAIVVAVLIVLWVAWVAKRVLIWSLISLFLALALNPAVEALLRRGARNRGIAAAIVYLVALGVLAGIGALVIPTLADQFRDLVDAAPGYVKDLTEGRGPLGWLETKYDIVERVQNAVDGGGNALPEGAGAALDVGRGLLTLLAGIVTITFLTFFMLLEGPTWVQRMIALLRPDHQPRCRRIAHDIYRLVGGYVTGNLLISFIAGTVTTIVLLVLGVPYALALGLLVAVLDLIPLAGATLGALIITLVALTESTSTALIVFAFFVVYQQLENHLLQPVVYGRTVELSPLAILLAVLIGAEVAGIVGALSAIPVAGTIKILVDHALDARRARAEQPAPA